MCVERKEKKHNKMKRVGQSKSKGDICEMCGGAHVVPKI